MLFASARKSASRKKWHVLVRLDRFQWFNHHWIAFELFYNMSLEPIFFHRAVPKLHAVEYWCKNHNFRYKSSNPVYNVLTIINKDKTTLPLDHARLLWLLKLFEGFLEGLFGVFKQPAPMVIHVPPAQHNHSCWKGTASDRNPNQLHQKSWQLHTQWNCVAVPSLAYNMNSWYNVLPSSLVFHWSNTVLRVCMHVTCLCMGVHERGEREGGRGWVAVNS